MKSGACAALYLRLKTHTQNMEYLIAFWTAKMVIRLRLNMKFTHIACGTAVAQWLRCCATNQKVAV